MQTEIEISMRCAGASPCAPTTTPAVASVRSLFETMARTALPIMVLVDIRNGLHETREVCL